jgi:serine/threonine-protein kinase
MPAPTDSSFDREEALARLADAIGLEIASGRTLNLSALAERFGVLPDDARRCKEAVEAIGLALGEDVAPLSAESLSPPSVPADYELLGEIGRGGMGVVYRARQRSLGRTVALKVLRPGELFFGDAIRRFRNEAQSLARLRHRHIVSIHEVGESGGQVFYTMDLVEGTSLAELIRRKEMTPTRTVKLLRQVASAITYAHSQGIIHRDLKPANILVDAAGDAYVVDFGLARDAAVKGDLTATGHLLGTPAYMSPEQARGDSARIGEATDIYSLGAVLYECLTARAPFAGRSLADLIHAVIHEDPAPPRRVAPRTPRDLEIICQKAMAKDPERRFATVRAMLEDLERFEEGRPIRARRPSLAYRASRFAGRHAATLTATGVTGALLSMALVFLVIPRIGKTPETLLSTAEELHLAGEHAGAVVLCERALKGNPPDETARNLEAAVLRCRLEVVRAFESQGRWPEALALCENMKRFSRRDTDPEVLWELSRCLAKKGDSEGAGDVLEEFKEGLEDRRRDEDRDSWTSPVPQAQPNIRIRMLERAAPALLDPEDPGHEGAGVLFLQSFGVWYRHDGDVDRWLASQGDRGADLVIALLPFLKREYLSTDGSDLYESVTAIRGSRLDTILLGFAQDPRKPMLQRRFAADLLSTRLDLPFWFGSWREKLPGRDDPRLIDKAVALAESLRDCAAPEGFRRRVEAAITALRDGPHNEDYDVWWISEWLMLHTGIKPKGKEALERVAEWQTWWQNHGKESPVEWVTRALNLTSAPPVTALLDRYLRCPDLDERILLHQLLVLTAPAGTRAPFRRYAWGRREPSDRAMVWYRELRGSHPEAPYLLRIAHFTFRNGSPDPQMRWQELLPIQIGKEVGTSYHFRSELEPTQGIRILIPGVEYERGIPMRAVERRRQTAQLNWEQDGLIFHCGQTGPQGIIVADNDLFSKEIRRDHAVETAAVLSVALPPGSDGKEWTLSDWKAKIHEDLKFLLKGVLSDAGNKDCPFFMRYQVSLRIYPQLAAHFAMPEARETLARLDDATRSHRHLGRDDRNHSWIPARLMAGDPAPIDQPDFKGRLEKIVKEQTFGTAYACRLYRSAQDPKIRDVALALLQEREIPDGVCLDLRSHIKSRGLPAPAWLSERVESASLRDHKKDRGPRLLCQGAAIAGGFVGLAVLIRTLWPGLVYQKRLRAAAFLILIGLGFVATVVEVDGRDLLPDMAGYGFMAVGALILARAGQSKGGFLPAGAFSFAAIFYTIARLWDESLALFRLSTLAAAVGICTLPLLIRAMDLACTTKHHRTRKFLISFFPLVMILLGMIHLGTWVDGVGRKTGPLLNSLGVLMYVIPAITLLAWGSLFASASELARLGEPNNHSATVR